MFYKPGKRQRETDNAPLYKHLEPSVDRFDALAEQPREEFRNRLSAYVKLYGFPTQIMPFQDADLEERYTFLRLLESRLPQHDRTARCRGHGGQGRAGQALHDRGYPE